MEQAVTAFTNFISSNSAAIISMVTAGAGLSLTIRWIKRVFK